MEGVSETDARQAMRLAAAKLPIRTKFATRFAQENVITSYSIHYTKLYDELPVDIADEDYLKWWKKTMLGGQ